MEFYEWITKKYTDWRGDAIGQDRSISEFAAMLKVPQSLMSQWMKRGGIIPNSKKYINILVENFGVEAYDVLGMPRPSLSDTLSSLSPEQADAVVHALAEIRSSGLYNGNAEASPEEVERIKDILEKHLGKYQ
jgi:hypothetical protein